MGNIQAGDKQIKTGKSPTRSKNFIKNLNRKSSRRESKMCKKDSKQSFNEKLVDKSPHCDNTEAFKFSNSDAVAAFFKTVKREGSTDKLQPSAAVDAAVVVGAEAADAAAERERGGRLTGPTCRRDFAARSTNRDRAPPVHGDEPAPDGDGACPAGAASPAGTARNLTTPSNNSLTVESKTSTTNDSSSDSVFTTEINQCYYSAESDSTLEEAAQLPPKGGRGEGDVSDTARTPTAAVALDECASLHAGDHRSEVPDRIEEKEMSLNVDVSDRVRLAKDAGAMGSLLAPQRREPEAEEPHECNHDFTDHRLKSSPAQTSFTLSRHRKVELPPTKLNEAFLVKTSDVFNDHRRYSSVNDSPLESNVLRKVASLTLDQATAADARVQRTKLLEDKLDFQFYEKFEGQMLLNWFASSVCEENLKTLLNAQDLKTLGIRYCTHLLTAGVLRQIHERDEPADTVFRPDMMYSWSHTEASPMKPVTPGRIHTLKWPPICEHTQQSRSISNSVDFDAASKENDVNLLSFSEDICGNELNIENALKIILHLKKQCESLKIELAKYKALSNIQALTQNAQEFPSLIISNIKQNCRQEEKFIRNLKLTSSSEDESNKNKLTNETVINIPELISDNLDITQSHKLSLSSDSNITNKIINETATARNLNRNESVGMRSDEKENCCKLNKIRDRLKTDYGLDDINTKINTVDDCKLVTVMQCTTLNAGISSGLNSIRSTKVSYLDSSKGDLKVSSKPALPDAERRRLILKNDTVIEPSLVVTDVISEEESCSTSIAYALESGNIAQPIVPQVRSSTVPDIEQTVAEVLKLGCNGMGPPPFSTDEIEPLHQTMFEAGLVPSPVSDKTPPSLSISNSEPSSAPVPDIRTPSPPVPGMDLPPPAMQSLGQPLAPATSMGPPPPPMPCMGPPPPPMPGMGPPPPPMPDMGPAPPPPSGTEPLPPPMPGMGPRPPPTLGMGPPPPPMPCMGPQPPAISGVAPPPPPMPGMRHPPPPVPAMGPSLHMAGMSSSTTGILPRTISDDSSPPVPPTGIGPPPPPMSGPVPFPPPPVGGWNIQRATMRKTPVVPSVPMKPLYWTRILAPAPNSPNHPEPTAVKPLWVDIEEARLDNIDEFTNLFSRHVVTKKPAKKKLETKTKIQPVKILDSKRSQNVGILASSLHVEFSEIENAVYNFDTSVVSLEALHQIYELRATDDELAMIKEHLNKKSEIPLDKPEGFLHDLSGIPNFAERISCFMFQAEFEDSISTIMHKLDNLKRTCEFLITNDGLKILFAIILTLGNYMNGGNGQRGQADGFGLEILAKLRDVKSKESTVTLLHFIVRTYIRHCGGALSDECALPVPEPGDVARSAAIDFNDVDDNLKLLKIQLQGCRSKMKKVLETDETAHNQSENLDESMKRRSAVFREKISTFLELADEKLKTENENLKECRNKFIATVNFYQYTPKTGKLESCEPKEFFGLWLSFCSDFRDIFKKEQQFALKEKLQEAKKRKDDIAVKPKKEGGLKARLQKLAKK